MKKMFPFMMAIMIVGLALSAPTVYAKKEGDPPGWSKGKKTGWGDADMPPGLAKKEEGKKEKKPNHPAKSKKKE